MIAAGPQNKRMRLAGLALAFALAFGLVPTPAAVAADAVPPYLANPSPDRDAEGVPPDTAIMVTVADDGVGVDRESVNVTIEGVIIDPIIEPCWNGFDLIIFPAQMFGYGNKVTVAVTAADRSGNWLADSWSFNITVSGNSTGVGNLYPRNNSSLAYNRELQHLRFAWTTGTQTDRYRLRVRLAGGQIQTLDLGPDDYTSALGMAAFSLAVEAAVWDSLAGLGELSWALQPLDSGGLPIGDWTNWWNVTYAPTDALVLQTPLQGAILRRGTPPCFAWSIDPAAVGYVFALARLDDTGEVGEEVYVADLPLFTNELPVLPEMWSKFSEGKWIWTVVSRRPAGTLSSYMLGRFEKDNGGER